MKKFLFAALVALTATALPFSTFAAEKAAKSAAKKTEKAAAEKKSANRSIPFKGTVKAFDKTQMTLTIAGAENDRQFQISSETRITKDGKPATTNEIAEGEKVTGAYKDADGKMTLTSLKVGEPATTEKKETKPKEKKAKK
jgi:hypothetical protein